MNVVVYIVGLLIVYLTGFLWGHLTFEVELTEIKFIIMLCLNSVLVMVGSYLIMIGLEPD